MRVHRAVLWFALPVFAGAGLIAQHVWQSVRVVGPPVLKYAPVINLGEQERGTTVTGRVTFSNDGESVLIIDDVRTSCACSGLQRQTPGGRVRVERLILQAEESAELVVDVAVNAPAATAYRGAINFRTNDPQQPAARLEFLIPLVKGGIVTIPSGVQFGSVAVGATVKKVLEVRDLAEQPRALTSVTSSDPERVRVRVLPLEHAEPRDDDRDYRQGKLIARLEVEIDTKASGNVHAQLSLSVAQGRYEPDRVAVFGKVAAPIEATPSTLILPRVSSGKAVYATTATLRATDGRPFEIQDASCPRGLTVSGVTAGLMASEHTVTATWDAEIGWELADNRPARIFFRCRLDGQVANVELPVYCWRRK